MYGTHACDLLRGFQFHTSITLETIIFQGQLGWPPVTVVVLLHERLCMTLCSLTPVVFHFHWLVQSKLHSCSTAPRVDDISFGISSFFLAWQCNRDMCLFVLHAGVAVHDWRSSSRAGILLGVMRSTLHPL